MECLSWQDFLDRLVKKKQNHLDVFKKLPTNEDRVLFCLNQSGVNKALESWLDEHAIESSVQKNNTIYTTLKASGNKAYVNKKNVEAIRLYSEGMCHACCGVDLAYLYGNRSAVLLAENRFAEAVVDIDLAIAHCYPAVKIWKLHKRKAEALNNLRQFQESRASYKNAISSLDPNADAKQIESLRKLLDNKTVTDDEKASLIEKQDEKIKTHTLHNGINSKITSASSSLTKKWDEKQGRYIIANQRIPSSSIIISEKPYAAVLLKPWYKSHCQHCFCKVSLVFPCHQCSQVRYCSEVCRTASWSQYHHFECGKLELLDQLGISRLALRIVLITPYDVLMMSRYKGDKTQNAIDAGCNTDGVYTVDYSSVYNLVSNSKCFSSEDSFQYACSGVILLKILLRFSFVEMTDSDLPHLGALLVRHIQQLVCNAHAITSLDTPESNDGAAMVVEQDQVRIATAIYPTTSLLNHSCEPTIVNCFDADRLIVKTTRTVEAGEQIYNCYGPHFRRMDLNERQEVLKQQYFFTCRCTHCSKGSLSTKEFNSYACESCKTRIDEDSMCCVKCGTDSNNRVVYCRSMNDACSEMFDSGLSILSNNIHQSDDKMPARAAIKVFQRCLEGFEAILFKSHIKIGKTHDALGRCYAMLADYKSSVKHVQQSMDITQLHFGSESVEATNEMLKLCDVYMAWIQQLIDKQDKPAIKERLPSTLKVIEQTLRLVKMNKEPDNEDFVLLTDRLESLNKLKYLCQF